MAENLTELHKLKKESTFYVEENPIQEYMGPEVMNAEAQQELLNTEKQNINAEAATAFENLWGNTSNEGYQKLLANAQRFDLEHVYGQANEREQKDKVVAELTDMAKFSSTRSEKSRKKHVKKASKAYKSAAKSFRSIGNKRERGGIGYIGDAEDSITQMIEAEIELVKAEGLKNNAEKYRLNRLKLKKNAMLINLYDKALENQQLSQKDRRKLTRKKQKIETEMARNNTEFLPVLVDQAIDWKTADTFTDNLVMNAQQFDKFVKKLNNGVLPPDVEELKFLLKTYHENQAKVNNNDENSNVLSLNSMKIVTDKCKVLRKRYKKNANIKQALDVLYTQCQRQTDFYKNRTLKEGDRIEDNAEAREEGDYVADDEFADYQVMSNREYIKQSVSNPYNYSINDEKQPYGSYDPETSLYGKRMQYDPDSFLEKQQIFVNDHYGYISTANGALINTYIRNPQAGLDAYRAVVVNSFLRRNEKDEDEDVNDQEQKKEKYTTLTKKQAEEIHGIDILQVEDSVRTWEAKIKQTIKRMDDATKQNELQQNTRFYRLVDKGFLQYALKLDENPSMQQTINSINQKAGTIVQDKAYMSTGFKVDDYFFSGQKGQPVMLTLLADKGTKCFVTANSNEGEVIFGKGTKYMILGAYAHGKDGKRVPITTFKEGSLIGEDTEPIGDETEEDMLNRLEKHESIVNKTALFKGIEIVAKIIKE